MKQLEERQRLLTFLKEQAAQKGITHQKWADLTGFEQSNITRMVNAKYPPTLDNFITIASAIGYEVALVKKMLNDYVSDEHITPKFLVSADEQTQAVYILHRHTPRCLVQVKPGPELRLIVLDLYDDIGNPSDILHMPFVDELKKMAKDLFQQ